MNDNILEVKNLSVVFDGEKIIDDLSFNLKEKENLVIIGPNGAGKSVLLKTLTGIIPFSGEIKWKKPVKIGYVPQKFSPEKNLPLTVEDFFKFKHTNSQVIKNCLHSVGINDLKILNRRMGIISSGQLQRVLIAWSLIDHPNILLFDEPTSGIDIEGEETIYALLEKLDKEYELTVIFVTHDLSIIYEFADSVLCLNKRSISYGAPHLALSPENLRELYGGKVNFHRHEHKN